MLLLQKNLPQPSETISAVFDETNTTTDVQAKILFLKEEHREKTYRTFVTKYRLKTRSIYKINFYLEDSMQLNVPTLTKLWV